MQIEKIDGKGLIRITTATAYLVAFLLSVFPTGAYFLFARAQLISSVEAHASEGARTASVLALASNTVKSAKDLDARRLFSDHSVNDDLEIQRIFDAQGVLIQESRPANGWWQTTVQRPIYGPGGVIGAYEVSRPLSDIMGNVLGIAIVSVWFATWSFLVLRILPNRALKNALKEALDSRETAQRAMLARDKAQEAARLRSVFLANMSHELRTPVNGVLGMIDLVSDTELDAEQHQYLQLAGASGRHLLGIINDILDFSKLEEGRIEIVPTQVVLNDVVKQVILDIEPECAKKGLSFDSKFDPALPAIVKFDPLRVRQILVNLLGNAVKFTKAGKISLTVRSDMADQVAYIKFEVADTGIGISHEQLAYIFQPFTQADETTTRAHGGAGLGLAISHQLAISMGGNLWVDSELGRGSVFHLAVPLIAAD